MDSAGVPVWYKRGAANRIPHDLKRLADGSLAWFQTFGPGFGTDPANGYENFALAGTLVDLIQTVGVVTNHHELVQLPSGNFLLTSISPPSHPPSPAGGATVSAAERETGTYPAVTSDFVLRAVVQEVTPAGTVWSVSGTPPATSPSVRRRFRSASSSRRPRATTISARSTQRRRSQGERAGNR